MCAAIKTRPSSDSIVRPVTGQRRALQRCPDFFDRSPDVVRSLLRIISQRYTTNATRANAAICFVARAGAVPVKPGDA